MVNDQPTFAPTGRARIVAQHIAGAHVFAQLHALGVDVVPVCDAPWTLDTGRVHGPIPTQVYYPHPVGCVGLREAREAAAREYAYRAAGIRSGGAFLLLSFGSDGGMHYRGDVATEREARDWVSAKTEDLVRRIMLGECTHTLYRSGKRLEVC